MSIAIDRLVRSKRKTIAVIIQPDGTLMVRAPLRASNLHIREFIQNHADWIRRKQAQAKGSPPPPKKNFRNGETFLYLGKEFPLKVVTPRRPALSFRKNTFLLSKTFLPKASQAFSQWYKDRSREMISGRVASWAKPNLFAYKKIHITSARTRWGSCSTSGTLSFTWRLMMAPLEIVDYVVLHELVHTRVKNHSKAFWQMVGDYMPEYKTYVRWLKQNGKYLTI
jgi:hypothetical protein